VTVLRHFTAFLAALFAGWLILVGLDTLIGG